VCVYIEEKIDIERERASVVGAGSEVETQRSLKKHFEKKAKNNNELPVSKVRVVVVRGCAARLATSLGRGGGNWR
jgi:hypothetical protein